MSVAKLNSMVRVALRDNYLSDNEAKELFGEAKKNGLTHHESRFFDELWRRASVPGDTSRPQTDADTFVTSAITRVRLVGFSNAYVPPNWPSYR